ncbi:MAG: O-antigen ligase family protein [Verrucomicrobiota bacterium]|nr:O-antigen ligase family protein [Verrucomicrobiota bacterium]
MPAQRHGLILCGLIVVILFFLTAPGVDYSFAAFWRVLDSGSRPYLKEVLASSFILTLFVFVFSTLHKNKSSFQLPFYFVIAGFGFIFWQIISCLASGQWHEGLGTVALWVCYVLFFCLTRFLSSNLVTHDLMASVRVALWVPIIGAGYVILAYFFHKGLVPDYLLNTPRLTIAEAFLPSVFFILALSVVEFDPKKNQRIFFSLAFGLVVLAILQCRHRSPLLGLLAGTLWFSVCCYRQHLVTRRACLVPLFIIVAVLTFHLAPNPSNQFNRTENIQSRMINPEPHSIGYRIVLNNLALDVFADRPIFGAGSANFVSAAFPYQGGYLSTQSSTITTVMETFGFERAHNEFLQVLAENGIIGFILFLGILCFSFPRQHPTETPIENRLFVVAIQSGLLAFLICSVTSGFSFRWATNGFQYFFWAALGFGLSRSPVRCFAAMNRSHYALIIIALLAALFWQSQLLRAQFHYAKGHAAQFQLGNDRADNGTLDLKKAIQLNPDHFRGMQELADINLRVYDWTAAHENFELCAARRVFGASHLIKIARLKERLGLVGAEKMYQNAALSYPSSAWADLFYADFLWRAGRSDEAKKYVEEAKSRDPILFKAAAQVFQQNPAAGKALLDDAGRQSDWAKLATFYYIGLQP